MITLGERLKQLRKSRDWTQQDAANFTNMPRTTWAGYEQDAREPDLETLHYFSNVFEVSISHLIGENFQPPKQSIQQNFDFEELKKTQKLKSENDYLKEEVLFYKQIIIKLLKI